MDLCNVSFCFSKLFIQCNIGHIAPAVCTGAVMCTGAFNIYSYVCQSIGPSVSCVCLRVCDFKSEY